MVKKLIDKNWKGFFLVGLLILILSLGFVDGMKKLPFTHIKGPEPTKPWKNTVDAVSVVDLSGSMKKGGQISKINEAKNATKSFIDIVLNNSKSRLGLVVYSDSFIEKKSYPLSNDSISLKNKVNAWDANGQTCICCGVNKAIEYLNASTTGNPKIMVVMSDGEANIACVSRDAKKDAIDFSRNAWENHSIKVYTIGFGSDMDEVTDEVTLKSMAVVGNGSYYFAKLGELEEIYAKISELKNMYIGDDLYDIQSEKERTLWASIKNWFSELV